MGFSYKMFVIYKISFFISIEGGKTFGNTITMYKSLGLEYKALCLPRNILDQIWCAFPKSNGRKFRCYQQRSMELATIFV